MFVLKRTHEKVVKKLQKMESDLQLAILKYSDLLSKWTSLVNQVNKKGGREFLTHGSIRKSLPSNFTKEEIKQLIWLCHPDKHAGNPKANEMTAKLLTLR